MNFWFALALGFIIGWLIEWLIDWFFWRAQWKALRADLDSARAEVAALAGQRQRAFELERQQAAWQEKLTAEQTARATAEKLSADLTRQKTALEAELTKARAALAEAQTAQAELDSARAALTAAEADRARLSALAGRLAALELLYRTEASLRAAAEASEADLRARLAATNASDLSAVHFSAPLGGDEDDGLADRSALADAAQWEARLAELEAALNDPLAGGVHFSAPLGAPTGGEATPDGQLIDLKLKLSETLPDDVSFGVPLSADDGLADRSAMSDAAQWEARFAELSNAPDPGGVHFSAPMADDTALNALRDAHLAETQAAVRLAADAQAEAERLRARVAALESELEAARSDPLAGGVHFSAPTGDGAVTDPELERLQAELAYDRAAVNFAVQLDEEAAALRARVAALESELEAARSDPLAGGVHFSAPLGGEATPDSQLIDLKLKLSETLPDDVSFGVPLSADDGLADRSAMSDAAQWEARFAELSNAPDPGGVHFSAPGGADGEADVVALKQRIAELELRLSETAPLNADTAPADAAPGLDAPDPGGVHFSAPGFDDDSALADHELAELQNRLAADRAASLETAASALDPGAPEAVHFSAPGFDDEPAGDNLSFLTPGGCAHTDPLEDINGIGEVFAKRLREAGVCTFAQLARLTPAQVRRLAKVKDWQKAEPDKWIAEAALLAQRSA